MHCMRHNRKSLSLSSAVHAVHGRWSLYHYLSNATIRFFFSLPSVSSLLSAATDDYRTQKFQTIFTYIIVYVFVVMSTDVVYADPLGCNWMMAVTLVDGFIALRTDIVTCKLIVLIDWISKCSAAYGRCENDELKSTKMKAKL